jgi:hypothetical protein
MKFNTSKILLIWLLFASSVSAQKVFSLRGNVKEVITGKVLIGAAISLDAIKTGMLTDSLGNFYLRVPEDDYVVKVSFIGYKPYRKFIKLDKLLKSLIKQSKLCINNNSTPERISIVK